MRQRMFTFTDSGNDIWRGFAENQYGTRICLQEVQTYEFDKYLQAKNPELRAKLMAPQNNKKITKKWYIGSPKMNPLSSDGTLYNQWAKGSLEAAIQAAKDKCEETGEPQIVVQIVRVVRPAKQPVIVEKI